MGVLERTDFHHVIQSSQGFDEHIRALVGELIAAGDEEVESFVQIKIVMSVGRKQKWRRHKNHRLQRTETLSSARSTRESVLG